MMETVVNDQHITAKHEACNWHAHKIIHVISPLVTSRNQTFVLISIILVNEVDIDVEPHIFFFPFFSLLFVSFLLGVQTKCLGTF